MKKNVTLLTGMLNTKAVFVSVFLCILFTFPNTLEALNREFVELGRKTFKDRGCIACHTIGKGRLSGPDLLGVTERREESWLKAWLKSPDKMVMTDPVAREMLKEFFVPMPNQNLSDEEVKHLIEYLKSEDARTDRN